jgi:hypothetical protein
MTSLRQFHSAEKSIWGSTMQKIICMKKALLFTILALSINAFPQSNHPTFRSNENVQDKMHNEAMKIFKLNSEMNLEKTIKPQPLKPQDLIQIIDSIYQWQWDTISAGWTIDTKTINIVYDAKHNMTSNMAQTWSGSGWVNYFKNTNTYDTSNNLTSTLYQNWYGSIWVNVSQNTYTYDANNNLTRELMQSWHGSDWVNESQDVYTYDSNNNRTSWVYQYWKGSDWVNSLKYTYAYDTKNNLTSELGLHWTGSNWIIDNQSNYTYDANNNLMNVLCQYWHEGNLMNLYQVSYSYDANNNLTRELMQRWIVSNWVNFLQDAYTYDANKFEKSHTSLQLNNGTKVTAGDSTYYYYHTVLGINDLMVQNGNLTVYPNPTSTIINIKTTTKGSFSILNISGLQILQQEINEQTTTVDVSGLKSGVYFVHLTSDKSVATGKFLKQ